MKLLITGHRRKKLEDNGYDFIWIENSIGEILEEIKGFKISLICYAGMADGVDMMFCNMCNLLELPYIACIPFEGQDEYMNDADKLLRKQQIASAKEVKNVKNSWMVEHCDSGIVVWDGNKGGTHNVVQQLVEKKKNFYWINPVSKVVWKCFV